MPRRWGGGGGGISILDLTGMIVVAFREIEIAVLVTLRVFREENEEMVTFRAFSLQHLVFSGTFQGEIYSIFKQIFLLNAQFTIVCFDVTLW